MDTLASVLTYLKSHEVPDAHISGDQIVVPAVEGFPRMTVEVSASGQITGHTDDYGSFAVSSPANLVTYIYEC